MRKDGEVYYLHADHLGTASLTTDSGGAEVHQVRHLPFGGERWSSGSDVSDRDFTGQRLDTSFGLHDYNARYYDSVLGRFISADSIVPNFANPQSLNRYSYVYNRPLNLNDPSGHCPPIESCIGYVQNPFNALADEISGMNFYATDPEGLRLDTVKSGVPTAAGVKVDGGIGADMVIGQQDSGGVTIVYNWYSGEFSVLPNVSMQGTLGTPSVANAEGSIKAFVANGATSNEMFTGAVNSGSLTLSGDAFGKAGLTIEGGQAVESTEAPSRLPANPELISAIDPDSKRTVNYIAVGPNIGLNMVPNAAEIKLSWSPGLNNTWDLQNWLSFLRE